MDESCGPERRAWSGHGRTGKRTQYRSPNQRPLPRKARKMRSGGNLRGSFASRHPRRSLSGRSRPQRRSRHPRSGPVRRVSGPTRVEPLQPKETLSAPPTDQRNGLNPPLPANAVRYPSELSCGDPSRRADPSFPCAVRSIRVCIAGDGLGRCVDRISALLSPDPFLFRPGPVTRSVNSIFADREVSNQSRRFGYSQVTS